ncbi:Nurim [Actinoplanes sp. SE50]|uniref:methyltransferase family protein n=1 Tax=unclassified Actinoplanes TaxID=2626549 RepID=UPI00023EBBB3|nr:MULTISPECIES: NnrU family protein [unclassified Actinoplanes]AEV85056.1 Nurim [Actinoplanes sp. SE50/110]ATO83447.1 Nurim [Actinoplanes sp. SE50]SLM00854.1 Nurim [Actinoplanes sp. SE50/110]
MVILGYAVLAYVTFLFSIGWAVVFLTGPVDGPATHSPATALTVDALLLLAFAVQHTIMARPRFKRHLPAAVERSTFVLAASLVLVALFAWWEPVPAVVWRGSPLLWVLYAAGWALAVAATYMIDHFDMFGLKQAVRRDAYQAPAFRERWLYKRVRHPMMLGMIIAFWATPTMTVGHLFFAVASTGYIAIGIRFEERDLRRQLGDTYAEYAARVPMLIPGTRRAHSKVA